MKTLTIIQRLNGSNKNVTWLRAAFDYQLPELLVDFVCTYGGTETEEYLFPSEDDYYAINFFLPIESTRNASIELILPAVRDPEEGIGRDDLLPFAVTGGGNPFYVSIGATDKDNVYLDIIGYGDEEPMVKVANSFEEFIDKLQSTGELKGLI